MHSTGLSMILTTIITTNHRLVLPSTLIVDFMWGWRRPWMEDSSGCRSHPQGVWWTNNVREEDDVGGWFLWTRRRRDGGATIVGHDVVGPTVPWGDDNEYDESYENCRSRRATTTGQSES